MNFMPIEHIPDWEKRLERQNAFWHGAIIDRPVVCITVPKKKDTLGNDRPVKQDTATRPRTYASDEERWMDFDAQACAFLTAARNTDFLGDALPHGWPNLGPDLFAAFFGAELKYGDSTTWSEPCLHDWADADLLQFSEDNAYFKKINELTDVMLDAGKGQFYTGLTDLHSAGDALAAFRDPLHLNMDMIEHVVEVKALLHRITKAYFDVFDRFYKKLSEAGQPLSSWAGIVSPGKWYIPSNDFSCMISKEMFDDVFLPGIAEECRFFDTSLYHLDGPDALRHLDSLLEIPELNAIQWVYGAGNGRASDWMHVYKKCQAAGKGLELALAIDELDFFMDELRPEGLWLSVGGVKNRQEGEAVIRKVARWS